VSRGASETTLKKLGTLSLLHSSVPNHDEYFIAVLLDEKRTLLKGKKDTIFTEKKPISSANLACYFPDGS
jgi:hypothetical protein